MSSVLLSLPASFLLYLGLALLILAAGRLLAGPARPNPVKSSTYASGEAPPRRAAAPGYRPFFVVALFFAVLHLGVLIASASRDAGGVSSPAVLYLAGLIILLLVLLSGEPDGLS